MYPIVDVLEEISNLFNLAQMCRNVSVASVDPLLNMFREEICSSVTVPCHYIINDLVW